MVPTVRPSQPERNVSSAREQAQRRVTSLCLDESTRQQQKQQQHQEESCLRRRSRVVLIFSATLLLAVAVSSVCGRWGLSGSASPPQEFAANVSDDPDEHPEDRISGTHLQFANHDGGGGQPLPVCFSSPEADPSRGSWRRCQGGVEESPATMVDWTFPRQQFGFLDTCRMVWNSKHVSHGPPQPAWTWETELCSLETVTREKFCSVMEGRKGILLVGDSLTRLSTTTLASILRAKSVQASPTGDIWAACGGKLKIRFIRNDFLDTGRHAKAIPAGLCKTTEGVPAPNTVCAPFGMDRILQEFDTLVVNSGAHFQPREEYASRMKTASRTLGAAMRRLHGDAAILVVRNTPPGHWNCTPRQFTGPVDSDVAQDMVDAAPEDYHWSEFRESNTILEEAFSVSASSNSSLVGGVRDGEGRDAQQRIYGGGVNLKVGGAAGEGWKILDAYTPTTLRADSHIGGRDCLHYCLPGPVDHWITLLYNIILQQKADMSHRGEGPLL